MADNDRLDPAGAATTSAASDPVPEERPRQASTPDDKVADLQRDRDELYDRLLRKSAEFDNYRKRIERERREQSDEAVTDLLRELLLVVDDFDLALAAEQSDSGSPYRKGIELIRSKLHDLLRKYGVQAIPALGTDFDPNVHQAVTHEASPNHRDGEVIGELRRGYTMGDRLLRPAMVKVAKA